MSLLTQPFAPVLAATSQSLKEEPEAPLTKALGHLLGEADYRLIQPLRTVEDKTHRAPTGDIRDYSSIGRYYWPHGDDPTRLPWQHRDGAFCRYSVQAGDFPGWLDMGLSVETLGMAWYFTGREAYAIKALEWFRAWFQTPQTRLNPNFNHAGSAPGFHHGGGIGLIEAVEPLTWLLNGAGVLIHSPYWQPRDTDSLHEWLHSFYQWIRHDPSPQRAFKNAANIGVWSEALKACIGLFLGDTDTVAEELATSIPPRVTTQIAPDGSQPRELRRTLAFHYSTYHLEAIMRCVELAGYADVNLTAIDHPVQKAIRQALLYLCQQKPWPYPDLVPPNFAKLHQLLQHFLRNHDDEQLHELARGLPIHHQEGRWALFDYLFYPIFPSEWERNIPDEIGS